MYMYYFEWLMSARNTITYLQNPRSMASNDSIIMNAWLMSARNTANCDTAASS